MKELNKLIYEEQYTEMGLGELDSMSPVNIQKEDMDAYLKEKQRTKQFKILERENEHEKDREEKEDEILEMIDVYYIIPEKYEHYGLEKFEVIHPDFQYQTFAVGTEDDVKTAAWEYGDSLIDDIGITGFNESFWKNFLDEDEIVSYFESVFEDDLAENPDAYFDDSDRMLDSKQMDEIKYSKTKIASIKNIIQELESLKDEEEDEEKLEQLDERIEYMEDQIVELEDEIENIESEPEGDFPQELIDEKLADMLNDVERNPERYMEEYGLNAEDYVDRDKFIEGVIDEDGYGQLSSYDGSYEIFNVMGTSYYVFRID